MEGWDYNPCNRKVILRTYQAYFGGIIDMNFGQNGQVIKGTYRMHIHYTPLTSYIDMLQQLWVIGSFEARPPVTIYCDDSIIKDGEETPDGMKYDR